MNLAGFARLRTTWSEGCRPAHEPLCKDFFSTLLALIIHVPSTPIRVRPLQPRHCHADTPHLGDEATSGRKRGFPMVITPGQPNRSAFAFFPSNPDHE